MEGSWGHDLAVQDGPAGSAGKRSKVRPRTMFDDFVSSVPDHELDVLDEVRTTAPQCGVTLDGPTCSPMQAALAAAQPMPACIRSGAVQLQARAARPSDLSHSDESPIVLSPQILTKQRSVLVRPFLPAADATTTHITTDTVGAGVETQWEEGVALEPTGLKQAHREAAIALQYAAGVDVGSAGETAGAARQLGEVRPLLSWLVFIRAICHHQPVKTMMNCYAALGHLQYALDVCPECDVLYPLSLNPQLTAVPCCVAKMLASLSVDVFLGT
jgi:hypothetical protein